MGLSESARGVWVHDGLPVGHAGTPFQTRWDRVDRSMNAIDTYLAATRVIADAGTSSIATINGTTSAGTVVSKTGLTAADSSDTSMLHKTTLTLSNVSIAVTKGSNAGYGSQKLYDFPKGALLVHGSLLDLTITGDAETVIAADAAGDLHIGTTAQTDVAIGSIVATQHDIKPTLELTFAAVVTAGVEVVNATGVPATAVLDGSATAKDAYLNILIEAADISATNAVTVTGKIVLYWINLGTYSQADAV